MSLQTINREASSSGNESAGNDEIEAGSPKRKKHHKVKTGCITCRIRRVKCDEAKPSCLRCLKYGTQCGGYKSKTQKHSSSNNTLLRIRPLRPKSMLTGPYVMVPTINAFESNLERYYFSLFSNHIVKDLCPYFNPENWARLVLQACALHPSIRHAAVAIGALGKTCEIARLCKRPESGERIMMDVKRLPESTSDLLRTGGGELAVQAYSHHRQALEQYQKAIRCMRDDMKNYRQDLRTSLIICMMIICFEGIHGNYKSAAAQLYTGLSLVQEFQAKTRRGSLYPQGYRSPSPETVEDFLVQSFGRLEIQSMSVFDPRPVEIHTVLKYEGEEVIAAMPSSLKTLEDARAYLDLITRRIMHFNGSIHTPRVKLPHSDNTINQPPLARILADGNSRNYNPIPWIDLKVPLSQTHSILQCEALQREKSNLLLDLNAWNKASEEVLRLAVNQSPRDAIAALTFSIAAQSNKISLCSAFFLNEIAYDEFLPEFQRIVDCADQIIRLQKSQNSSIEFSNSSPSPSTSLNFSYELGLIPPLYTVITKCRHGPTRHKALSLLRQNPHREGVWDSVASSGLGAWVIGLEEEGARRFIDAHPLWSPTTGTFSDSSSSGSQISNGNINFRSTIGPETFSVDIHIPEEVRVRKAKMRFDLLERRASLTCMQVDFDSGLFVEKTGLFRW